jgi:hypothetical protein
MAAECRLGFAFNNPELLSCDGFGSIITPDELRYVYAFGNDLVAPNGQTITDETLQWYIDNSIGSVENDLRIKLKKRVYKYRPTYGTTRDDLSGLEEDVDYEFEDPYDFVRKNYKEFTYIKLRNRPIISVEKAIWNDVQANKILDITEWLKPNYKKGSLEFFPNLGGAEALAAFLGVSSSIDIVTGMRWRNYPDGFQIDYTAGFKTSTVLRKKHPELFTVIGKLAAIMMLSDYGDGKTAAIASSSISLSGLSESVSTTLSATSATFGARILQYTNELKEWFKINKNKYSGFFIGAL